MRPCCRVVRQMARQPALPSDERGAAENQGEPAGGDVDG